MLAAQEVDSNNCLAGGGSAAGHPIRLGEEL